MGSKLKLLMFICLVGLLAALPAFGACAAKPKVISALEIKVDAVEPIGMVVKPYDPPRSLASEFNTFHVILSITNPNDFLVTAESLEAQVFAEDISLGWGRTDGPIYLPAGKKILVRLPFTRDTRIVMLEQVVVKQKPVPEALKMVLDTWTAIQNLKAKYQVKGGVQVTAETAIKFQNFDLRWP